MKRMWITYLLRFVGLLLVLGGGPQAALATAYVVLPFPDDPAASPGTTHAMGINNAGQIVGWELVGGSPIGFLRSPDGTFTRTNCGEVGCRFNGINNHGVIVGASLLNSGLFTAVQVNGEPGGGVGIPPAFARTSEAFGVNDNYPAGGPTPPNTIVGSLTTPAGKLEGFQVPSAAVTIFPGPSGVISTQIFGLSNDQHLFVGTLETSPGVFQGFFQTGPDIASSELVTVAGATRTDAFGTQFDSSFTHPAVVGEYTVGGQQHGFVLPAGNGDILQGLQTIDLLDATNTRLYGINDAGQIVAQSDSHSTHGDELTPFDDVSIGIMENCLNNPVICQGQINQGHIGTGDGAISCAEDPALCGVVSQDLALLVGPNPPSVESLIIITGAVSVPEPSSLILLATGVVAIWSLVWRRRVTGRVTTPTFAPSAAK
jgi:hypothetical protein